MLESSWPQVGSSRIFLDEISARAQQNTHPYDVSSRLYVVMPTPFHWKETVRNIVLSILRRMLPHLIPTFVILFAYMDLASSGTNVVLSSCNSGIATCGKMLLKSRSMYTYINIFCPDGDLNGAKNVVIG